MSAEEFHRASELKDMFVIIPAFKSIYENIKYEYPDMVSTKLHKSYISENETPLTKVELKKYLIDRKVLDNVDL